MSYEVSDTIAMISSMSSTVSTVWNGGLVAFDFFCDEGFFGEPFLFLEVSASGRGYLGSGTSPFFFLSSPPSSSSLSTSSPPPSSGEFGVVSFDALLNSCTSSFFFFLLLLGASYSSRVTTRLSMRLGSDSYAWSTSTRNYAGHSLVISSMSSSMSL
jgi:hypothetical protein